jgi:hypothetical protein
VWLDNSNLNGLETGLGAHEFGHAFLGIQNAYSTIKMPNGYVTPWVYSAPGWGNSIMASMNGVVRASDLQTLVTNYMQLQGKVGK